MGTLKVHFTPKTTFYQRVSGENTVDMAAPHWRNYLVVVLANALDHRTSLVMSHKHLFLPIRQCLASLKLTPHETEVLSPLASHLVTILQQNTTATSLSTSFDNYSPFHMSSFEGRHPIAIFAFDFSRDFLYKVLTSRNSYIVTCTLQRFDTASCYTPNNQIVICSNCLVNGVYG